VNYYYSTSEGVENGPISIEELTLVWSNHSLPDATRIRREDSREWIDASSILHRGTRPHFSISRRYLLIAAVIMLFIAYFLAVSAHIIEPTFFFHGVVLLLGGSLILGVCGIRVYHSIHDGDINVRRLIGALHVAGLGGFFIYYGIAHLNRS